MTELEFLSGIAPSELRVNCSHRYLGDEMSATLADLGPASKVAVLRLYELLKQARQTLQEAADGEAVPDSLLKKISSSPVWDELIETARILGTDMLDRSAAVRQVVHDLRGGSLVALIGTVQLLAFSSARLVDLQRCAHFARDHLKIMRNCLPEIDPVAVLGDRQERSHSIELIVEKWAGSEFRIHNASKKIRFSCTFRGAISECCMEFAAIDRVIYNLINNAAQHTANDEVALSIFPVGSEGSRSVRFVVYNSIAAGDASKIQGLTDGRVDQLMKGGISTTGSGLGLRICAEFVSHAYGLRSVDEVLSGGYAGTKISAGSFYSWFHWPCAA